MKSKSYVLRRDSAWRGLLLALMLAPAVAMADAPTDALPSYKPKQVTVAPDATYRLPDGSVAEGGAEHVHYILERLNARFTATHPAVRFTDLSKGTTSALPLLTHGRILFGSMGRGIAPLEVKSYAKIVGAPPLEIRIAHTSDDTSQHLATSLAVYVNRANPLTTITREQLSRIMTVGNAQGDLSTWGQLGLPKAWAARAIHPYGTPEFTGFGTYMQREQLGGRPLAATYEQYGDTDDILERLAADPAGIAVAALGRETPELRQLAIADTPGGPASLGSREDVRAGRYPLGRYLLLYVRRVPGKPVDPLVKEYLRLVLSAEGQAVIAGQEKGYIPLTPAEARAELAKLD
ncbi:PstS family phosphate ABC transporter substrate-binding protein [Novosphingobium terrae]|uniref:PstS family phosphate ABC transporter substrate-binding protein n=1 Tax=Novosphingobium terrae TaxID=2726189 RepID=UPI00197E5FB4|nr:substrate-binding domain-containing protein [Novosphingobium terrae]